MWKYLAEILGVFIYVAIFLKNGTAIPLGIAVATSVYLVGDLSGAHLNPVVSLVMWNKGALKNVVDLTMYIASQFVGGFLALLYTQAK